MTFNRADILLPAFSADSEKMKKWSVVACDQYTSEPDYWEKASGFVGDAPSTLAITVPEIYLSDCDIDQRIKNVNARMQEYMDSRLFKELGNSYIFVERTLSSGAKRLGIVGAVDLEDYDYAAGSKTAIRATEGTVTSRIPPRLRVRENAAVELPHIMMLIDDRACDIIESNLSLRDGFEKVYDFDLMADSGHITGYRMTDEAAEIFEQKLSALSDIGSFNQKYGVNEQFPLVFAMGDGNHSLATAKAYYENLKKTAGEEFAKNSPARYALCELVNLHDKSLVFEAIHRVVFYADGEKFLSYLGSLYDIEADGTSDGQSFVLSAEKQKEK